MTNDASPDSSKSELRPIRRQEGNELPEEVDQKLKDAVWAGLAQKMQEDKEMLCKKYGHEWVEGPSNTVVCKRCNVQKVVDEEHAESSEQGMERDRS